MKVITVVSDTNNDGFNQLKRSLDYFGYTLDVLIHPFQFGGQMKHVYEWCKNNWGTFLYTDGWDTFALAYPDEVLRKYNSLNCRMLISAEKNCYPVKQTADLYPTKDIETEWKYCNGGGFIGDCEMFVEMYEDGLIDKVHERNDQQWLAEQFINRHNKGVVLDTGCEIFQTVAFEGEDDFARLAISENKYQHGWKDRLRLLNKKTNSTPCFLHGNAHTPMAKFYKLL